MAKSGGGKLSSAYWIGRVYRPIYTGPDGERRQVETYWARIGHGGRRHAVGLGVADKRAAAAKAAAFYGAVIREGWDHALAALDPERHAARSALTVGDVLAALDRLDMRPRTRTNYAAALRWWAARHLELRPGPKEFSRDSEAWRARLAGVPLSALSVARLEAIRDAFLAGAAGDVNRERRARVSIKSYLRNARAAVTAAEKLGRLTMPDPKPFSGLVVAGAVTLPYRSKIDPSALLRTAQAELRRDDPDAWRVVLLALGAGLRRGEIESLRWSSVDPAAGRIYVEAHGGWAPKTAESEAAVDVDAGLLAELEAWRPEDPDASVVATGSTEHAVRWLRTQGVDSNKPLHTLRKEFGSIVAHSADLLTASRQLRHSSLSVTAQVYIENRRKSAPAIGAMLTGWADDSQNQPKSERL